MSGRVRVTRGDIVESEHRIHAVVTGTRGRELVWGDPGLETTLRSAAKLFQALPLIEDGVADALALSDAELALCCASHNSEAAHVEGARALLERVGLDESALACGPHRPMSRAAAEALDALGERPGRIHNNCSGKHAGMLALAVHHRWDPVGYHLPDHPVQRRMALEISRWSGVAPEAIPMGVDGCGIPCFSLPLETVAQAFHRFVASSEPGPARLLDAIASAPSMIAGEGRLCSRIAEVTGGRVIAKIGAEGVYGAVVRETGFGVALKVEDGARRAVEPALLAVLDEVGALSDGELEALGPFRRPPLSNTRGETVGRIEAHVSAPTPSDAPVPAGRP